MLKQFIIERRIKQLKLMNELVCLADNEALYDYWITLAVPDEPREEDFEEIATDNESFNYCVSVFRKIIKDKDFF